MILFIFATFAEAQASLSVLKAKEINKRLYKCHEGWLAISGIGIHAAQHTTSQYGPSASEIWNFGLAGSLQEPASLGDICPIATVSKYVPSLEDLDTLSQDFSLSSIPSFSLKPTGYKLFSSDFPIHTFCHKEQLAKKADLVDMEGYGIAYAAHHLGKPCSFWKIISDFTSFGGHDLIKKNMCFYSEKLAETLLKELKKMYE